MVLAKDGQTVELHDPAHIAAYLHSGWVEQKPTAEKPKRKPSRKGERS